MPIELRQPGEAKAVAKAGAIIGNAQTRAMEWEMEKAAMRSQQDFEFELRLKEWEFQKAQMQSQIDFEKGERERAEKEQQLKSVLKQIDETDWLSPQQKEKTKFAAAMKYQGIPLSNAILGGGTGVTPWHVPYLTPEYAGTEIGQAARVEQARRLKQIQPKTKSALQQKQEFESALFMQTVTPSELEDLGLDPAAFPLVKSGVTEPPPVVRVTTPEEYDVLDKGTPYIDSQGNRGIKQ